MFKRMILAGLASGFVLGAMVVVLTGAGGPQARGAGQASPASELSLIKVSGERITVEFKPPAGRGGMLEAELYKLDGKMLAKVTRRQAGRPIRVELYAQINEKDLSDYYLRYRFGANEEYRRRSLLFVGEILETTVLGQREFVAGTRPVIRVLVRDRAAGAAIEGGAGER